MRLPSSALPEAVVCASASGSAALEAVRSLGRRGIRIRVVRVGRGAPLALASRYCSARASVREPDALGERLLALARSGERPVLYAGEDALMARLAPRAGDLARAFRLAEPLADAERLTDPAYQVRLARRENVAVPRTWFPRDWEEVLGIAPRADGRLVARVAGEPALVASRPGALVDRLRALGVRPEDVRLQDFVEGPEESPSCYRALGPGRCFAPAESPVAGVAIRLARAAGLRGAFRPRFRRCSADGRWYFLGWRLAPELDLAWVAYCEQVRPEALDNLRFAQPARSRLFALDDPGPWLAASARSVFVRKRGRGAVDPGEPVAV